MEYSPPSSPYSPASPSYSPASPSYSPERSFTPLTNQASSSRPKSQRVEETVRGNWDIDGTEVITKELPRNLLECPICFDALTIPTFQCGNGHIACSSCCTKLKNKCPTCKVPTGKIRCRFAESVLEARMVPCPNVRHGCKEKQCSFALCFCPAPNCNYTGMYKDLYSHYYANHRDIYDTFKCGIPRSIILFDGMEKKVIQESPDGPLVVVQCFKVEQGMHVTANCIAPCAPEVEKLSYHFSYSSGDHTIKFGPVEMNSIQKVSFQNPGKGSCIFLPHCFLHEHRYMEMDICIYPVREETRRRR